MYRLANLQVFKSSAYQFWPILGSVVNAVHRHVFEIGLYGGCQKPSDVSEFLCGLVSDMKQFGVQWYCVG